MTDTHALFDWAPDLLAFLRRSWRTVALCVAALELLGVAYLLFATSHFTATSAVLIDMQASEPFKEQTSAIDSQFANGLAESQVEVLQSMGLARSVVRRLHLADDKRFLANGDSLVGSVLGVLLSPFAVHMAENADAHEIAAAELLTHMIRVKRIGMSFIIELSVVSNDPALSARLANAIVDGFVDSGLEAKNVNTRRASVWLQQRIGELQQQAVDADRAVQAFKAEAGIVDTDKGLMNERHLGELNSQLVLARARVADAKARLDRVHSIMRAGTWTGDVSDALQNNVITHLREEYVDVARQAAEWRAKVGPNHATVLQSQDKLADIQVQIQSELQRIADSTESDYQVALSNQAAIVAELASLVTDADHTNEKLVQLHELQSSAETYKALHANFLQRYTQAVQDQSFPISDVRVVSRADAPLRRSWPKALIVFGGAAFLGLCAGFGLALGRDALDRGLRTAAQVRARLGLPCLGVLPKVAPPAKSRRARRAGDRAPQIAAGASGERLISAPPILRQTLIAPFSPYAEAIRGLRIRLTQTRDGRRDVRVVGCVSALPGEGKSTVSANFAFFLAEAGFRTLLVDADLRKRSLSRLLAPGCAGGLAEAMAGQRGIDDALWRDAGSGLSFLPAAAERADTGLASLGDLRAQTVLADLRGRFDFVVIDLPATLPVADAAAASGLVDGVMLVVEWGATPDEVVRESIEHAAIEPRRILGVLLNKADLDALRHYPAAAGYAPAPPVHA